MSDHAETVTIRSQAAEATLSLATGALVSFTNSDTGWNVVRRPELGLSFRLLLPLEDRRNNPVFGSKQAKPIATYDQSSVRLEWATVESEFGGVHQISVVQTYRIQGSALTVETLVANESAHVVENVFSPYLGDIKPQRPEGTLSAIHHSYGAGMSQPLWPRFQNTEGYYGVDVPTQLGQNTPSAPYTLLQSEDQGLYIGVGEPTMELVAWHAELWPGYVDSLENSVPQRDEIAGVAVRTQFAAVHVPFLLPGESRQLTPITLEFYSGDWHSGADLYKSWRSTWLAPARVPDWAAEPHQWHQLQINSPEDELRMQFRDLVEVGREAAAAGVAAIQLVGFNEGGQDRNNPSHVPEPRLGGFDELKDAIAEIQKLGVKVVLFAKFTWADRSTEAFKTTWIEQSVKDPYGDYYLYPGYKYETVTQILDINTRRLVPMCFLSETYMLECLRQFQILVDLGADGILYDESQHHSPTLLCFDTSHGHRYAAPTYSKDLELVRRFRGLIPDREDFLFAGEAIYDWQFDQYAVSYHRSENRDHLPLNRYAAARQQMMTAVTGFDDRNMVNQALLYRYIVSYEPYNFKGRLTDFPDTVEYGRRMESLRRETREWTWDGLFTDTVGATVTRPDGTPMHPYSVFERGDGVRAVCVANYDTTPVDVLVAIDGYDGPLWSKEVDGKRWNPVAGNRLRLGGRAAVIVVPTNPERGTGPD